VGEIEKPPRKSIKEVGKLEPQIRWLKDETVFHLLARLLRQKRSPKQREPKSTCRDPCSRAEQYGSGLQGRLMTAESKIVNEPSAKT
jgi:hypothetical protein